MTPSSKPDLVLDDMNIFQFQENQLPMKFNDQVVNVQSFNDIDISRWHQVMNLRSQSFVTEQKCVYTDPDDGDVNATHVSILNDGKLIAYARIIKSQKWQIGRVAVKQGLRGYGLGSSLMSECLKHISMNDAQAEIELSAQLYLSSFYKNLRFHIIGSMYLEDGIPHIKMVYSTLGKTPVQKK